MQPLAAGDGFEIGVGKTDSSANTVIVSAAGAELIDGSGTFTLVLAGQRARFRCNGNRDDLLNAGSAWVTPNRNADPFILARNHQGIWCSHYLKAASGEDQRLVTSARSGETINSWFNGTVTGIQFDRILEICDTANFTGPFDWFGWSHGSADSGTSSTYANRFFGMLEQFQNEGLLSSTTPVFVCETSRVNTPEVPDYLVDMCADDPRCAIVRMGWYPTSDGTHFLGPALAASGWLAAQALSSIEGSAFENLIPQEAETLATATGYSRTAGI